MLVFGESSPIGWELNFSSSMGEDTLRTSTSRDRRGRETGRRMRAGRGEGRAGREAACSASMALAGISGLGKKK